MKYHAFSHNVKCNGHTFMDSDMSKNKLNSLYLKQKLGQTFFINKKHKVTLSGSCYKTGGTLQMLVTHAVYGWSCYQVWLCYIIHMQILLFFFFINILCGMCIVYRLGNKKVSTTVRILCVLHVYICLGFACLDLILHSMQSFFSTFDWVYILAEFTQILQRRSKSTFQLSSSQ